MTSSSVTVDVPLRRLEDGSIRIGSTRVLLELVIHAYRRGATAENIVESFPALRLSDVYAVLAYYLRNQPTIDAYVDQVDKEGDEMRRLVEASDPDLTGLRERLLERQTLLQRNADDDATGG